MTYTLLDHLPLWALFLATFGASWLAIEIGYYLGKWIDRRVPDEKKAPVGAIEGALLALLGFLLAFTFSIAVTFFSLRREALLNEANAIGTTYLRAGLLLEPNRSSIRQLLREYVSVRLEGVQKGKVAEAIAHSEELQWQLWSQATAVNEKQPHSAIVALFAQSLNEVIDAHAKRVTAGLYSRIPEFVWWVLYLVTLLAMAGIGYHSGLSGRRSLLANATLALAFSSVLLLVSDLDRPQAGVLRVSQQPLLDLLKSMKDSHP